MVVRAAGEAWHMEVGQRAHRRMCCQIVLEPHVLRGTGRAPVMGMVEGIRAAVGIQRDQMPGPEVITVVALGPDTGVLSEVLEVGRVGPAFSALVVAQHRRVMALNRPQVGSYEAA